ncbi:hypothetical protein AB1L30_05420 [Bremerella sp. JC817]|uniref:hypothetical protein n=1 Tax=Bremerella sp. JC817 TaxID=3231756 RepID=UPI0034579626
MKFKVVGKMRDGTPFNRTIEGPNEATVRKYLEENGISITRVSPEGKEAAADGPVPEQAPEKPMPPPVVFKKPVSPEPEPAKSKQDRPALKVIRPYTYTSVGTVLLTLFGTMVLAICTLNVFHLAGDALIGNLICSMLGVFLGALMLVLAAVLYVGLSIVFLLTRFGEALDKAD